MIGLLALVGLYLLIVNGHYFARPVRRRKETYRDNRFGWTSTQSPPGKLALS